MRMTKVTRCMSQRVNTCKVRLHCNEMFLPPAGGGVYWPCLQVRTYCSSGGAQKKKSEPTICSCIMAVGNDVRLCFA